MVEISSSYFYSKKRWITLLQWFDTYKNEIIEANWEGITIIVPNKMSIILRLIEVMPVKVVA